MFKVAAGILSIVFLSMFSMEAESASFSVSPVRIYLDAEKQIETITIKNTSDEALVLQMSIFVWSEDEAAKDVYSPTEDIVLFPKILEIEKGQERVIRVGARVPSENKEKTYRIYLEEIPKPGGAEQGATLRTLMRVGVPIFIVPQEGNPGGEIRELKLSDGKLTFRIYNTGNVHILIKAISVEGINKAGASAFSSEIAGWYLLHGNSRPYSVEIPADRCRKIKNLKISVNTDKISFEKTLSVFPEMCPR